MEIGERIAARREQLGLSQEELAHKLGYKDRSSIAKIETGINSIKQNKIAAFADALETSIAYIMGWEEAALVDEERQRLINKIMQLSPEQVRGLLNFLGEK